MPPNGVIPNMVENDREYHGYRPGLYMYPCDEAEMSRMDMYHHILLLARGQRLHQHPFIQPPNAHPDDEGPRIMDLGTGTGIWAIEMADTYRPSRAEVVGIDLANIQPQSIPPNLRFRVNRDYEAPNWSMGENSWDLIHLRFACGGVSEWPEMYQKIFLHLKPGYGRIEQVEIDYRPRCDDGPVPPLLDRWYTYIEDATTRGSKPIALNPLTRQMLHAQGFVDIEEQVIRLPLNTWPTNPQEQDLGRWHNLGMLEGLEALSMAPFTRCFRWPPADVRRFCKDVADVISDKSFHVYNNLHIFTARRP